MKNKIEKFFDADQTLILRSYRGERRLHFSLFHQFMLACTVVGFALMSIFLTANFIMNHFIPTDDVQITKSLRDDYEARIEQLVKERDELGLALNESQETSKKLVTNLGNQQELLFDLERNNYELENNLSALRGKMVDSQNRLDVLNLELDTQRKQIASIESGQGIGADSSTLSAITATLAETAKSRDEARAEVQTLRQEIAVNEQQQETAARRREVLFTQIEEAIEGSLVPMKSTLSKTGLNIDRLLNNIRSTSGIGGINVDADLSVLSNSPEGVKKIEKVLDDLDELSSLSYLAQTLPIGQPVKSGYRMSSGFGYRRHPISGRTKMHTGQDMAAPLGTPIYATGKGRIVQAGWISGYGKAVKIQHANGIQTLYGHMSKIRVKNGQTVDVGERIGDMGSTGNSTGNHLHYEVIINGTPTNPNNFLRASSYVQ